MSEYCSTNCKINGKQQSITVHRKVWMEQNGEIPKGFLVHHKNGNKKDNRIKNLKLVSHSEHTKLHNKERKRKEKLLKQLQRSVER